MTTASPMDMVTVMEPASPVTVTVMAWAISVTDSEPTVWALTA